MKTMVLGIGNSIRCDDGVGPYTASLLKAMSLPIDAHIDTASTIGLNLLDLLEDCERAFVIDSMTDSKHKNGTVLRFTAAELDSINKDEYSHHNLGLTQTLSFGRQNGLKMPRDIVIYAICAENVNNFGEGLSLEVEKGARQAARQILEEISS